MLCYITVYYYRHCVYIYIYISYIIYIYIYIYITYIVTLMSKTNSGTQTITTNIRKCWLPSTFKPDCWLPGKIATMDLHKSMHSTMHQGIRRSVCGKACIAMCASRIGRNMRMPEEHASIDLRCPPLVHLAIQDDSENASSENCISSVQTALRETLRRSCKRGSRRLLLRVFT